MRRQRTSKAIEELAMAGVLVAPKIQLSPVHLSDAWKSADKIIQDAVALLPNMILAAAVFIVFAIVARIGKWLISRLGKKKRIRQNAATLLGKLLQLAILMIGFLAAMSVVAPSFRLSDLIKILGIGGVAIGFAFKDILQNFLAGLLLLIHEPFQIGEQINVTGMEGAVNEIQSRATVIITPDGDHVVIPNATLFTNPVTVRKEKTGVLKTQKDELGQSRSSTEQGSEKKAESGEAKT